MLDQLVESKSNSQNTKRRGGYLVTTGVLVFSMFASGILWSLFAKDLNIGGDNLELSSIVAPVPVNEDVPPEPEPIKQVKQDNSPKVESVLPNRNDNIARIDENQPIPKDISTSPNTQRVRPNGLYTVNPNVAESDGSSNGRNIGDENTGGNNVGIVNKQQASEKVEDEPPPTVKKAEPKEEPKVDKPRPPVSIGVVNGKAVNLPKPTYSAAARAVRASGDVNVQVTIDEKGNVISASAVSGHALLRQAAESAARSAKFSPTLLSNQPVKVTGVIVYKFAMQ